MKINIFKKKIFRDTRGIIADVIYKNQINHIGYISSKKILFEVTTIIKKHLNTILFLMVLLIITLKQKNKKKSK